MERNDLLSLDSSHQGLEELWKMCSPAHSVSIELKKKEKLGSVVRGLTPLLPASACLRMCEERRDLMKEAWVREAAHSIAARPEQMYSRAWPSGIASPIC